MLDKHRELILKEILYNEYVYLLYEDIDKVDEDNPKTVGFKQALIRIKRICKINLGKYENYLLELANIRNQIQHYKFKISKDHCDKIIVQSFSAIEYIVIEILDKRFNDFEEYITNEQIEYLHEDKKVYDKRKEDIFKDINDNNLKRCGIEYINNKFIYIPCPICSNITLIENDTEIFCKFCGEKYESIKSIYEEDYNNIIQTHMLRQIGRRKDYFNSNVFECKDCNYEAIIFTDRWQCLACGDEFQGTINCEDCGDEIPDSPYNYVFAQSYYNCDDYMFLCKECGTKLYKSELGSEYEIR